MWKNISGQFLKLSTRKEQKLKPRKLPVIRGSTRGQGPGTWLEYDEEKGMVCEWCVEDKQTLVAQNVLNSNRFIDDCNSYKTESISQ